MKTFYDRCVESSEYIKSRIKEVPRHWIILGSGLSEGITELDCNIDIPFSSVPYAIRPDVAGHPGVLRFGKISGEWVMLQMGRIHYYEGYTMQEGAFLVFVAGLLGIRSLIVTNLVGGIKEGLKKGDIFLVTDHINLLVDNPVRGIDLRFVQNNRFVDMYQVYSPRYIDCIKDIAKRKGLDLKGGTLAFLSGPIFETKAELVFLRNIGADAVGWSLVPEVIAGKAMGMEILGLSCISDISNPDLIMPVALIDILRVGQEKSSIIFQLIFDFVKDIHAPKSI